MTTQTRFRTPTDKAKETENNTTKLTIPCNLKISIDVYSNDNKFFSQDLSDNNITSKLLHKNVAEMTAFLSLCGTPMKVPGWEKTQKFSEKLIFNSQYNCHYGIKNTIWKGSLSDGKNRGSKPYFCPVGWHKRAVSHKFFSAKEFDAKFKGWSIAYHGGNAKFALSILLSGLIPTKIGCFGAGVYVTPSITYAAHPRFTPICKIPENCKKYLTNLGKGDWLQFVYECRIHPEEIHVHPETLNIKNVQIDSNFSNSEMEWRVGNGEKIQDPKNPKSIVYITGIMIRITKKHPKDLPENKWWPEWSRGFY